MSNVFCMETATSLLLFLTLYQTKLLNICNKMHLDFYLLKMIVLDLFNLLQYGNIFYKASSENTDKIRLPDNYNMTSLSAVYRSIQKCKTAIGDKINTLILKNN